MPVNYRTPGVYIEEISSGLRPMDPVGTSTAGFVGPTGTDHELDTAVPIRDFSHYVRTYAPGGGADPAALAPTMAAAVMGFFLNGGALCYVVNIDDPGGGPLPGAPGSGVGLDALDRVDEVAIVAAPGFWDPASQDLLLSHCEVRKDRFAVLDCPPPDAFPTDVSLLTQVGEVAGRPTRRAAARSGGRGDDESDEGDGGGGAGDDGGDGPPPPAPPTPASRGFRPRSSERGFGAFYVPHIRVVNPLVPGEMIDVPPSGHVAGSYARTDTERGVHQPPANTPLRGAVGLARHISSAEQAILNPEGVNCIRYFGSDGILIWGARTVASDPEWRYVNVRRLFSFVEQTILRNTRWAVFEANGEPLWKSIDRTITAFLMRVWRSGALVGSTPEQAFFVQCDAETNPPEQRDAGIVRTVIGMAPVKPAEFVVFEISQHNDGVETVSEGAG